MKHGYWIGVALMCLTIVCLEVGANPNLPGWRYVLLILGCGLIGAFWNRRLIKHGDGTDEL